MLKNSIVSLLKQIWTITRGLFWTGLWLFGLGLLLWYPMRWWPGDRFLPVRLANYFMPWLLVALIPAVSIAGLARRRWLALTLATSTILIGLTFAPLFLPRPGSALAGNRPFKIMSYNIWGRNQNIVAVTAVIRQERPDILLLQEASPMAIRILNDKLVDLYPEDELHLAYEPGACQAIMSRYPLTPLGLAYEKGRVQKVLVDTPDGPIAVWNVHPSQPILWSKQYRQIVALAEDIAAADGPLIVGGDLNTTDQSETYRLISQYLDNAHWDAGWGFGFSFPAPPRRIRGQMAITSLVRIDHIFYSDHFFTHKARTLSMSGGSDHLPVVAELSLVK